MNKFIFSVLFLAISFSYSQDLETVKSLYLKGMIAFSSNNLAEAKKSFTEITALTDSKGYNFEPIKARAYYFIADIMFIEQKYERSIDYYKIVVQKYFGEDIYTKAMYKLGRTLIVFGRYDEGMAMLNDYIANYETNDSLADNALYWIGRGYAGKGDQLAALNTFRLVLEKYPSTTLSYEIRNSIDAITKIADNKNSRRELLAMNTNDQNKLQAKKEKMNQEKAMLEKMSRLLLIKQRLLEIKSEKVEILSKIKDQELR